MLGCEDKPSGISCSDIDEEYGNNGNFTWAKLDKDLLQLTWKFLQLVEIV